MKEKAGQPLPAWAPLLMLSGTAALVAYTLDTLLGTWYIPINAAAAAGAATALIVSAIQAARRAPNGSTAAILASAAILTMTGAILWHSFQIAADRRTRAEAVQEMEITILGHIPGDRDINFTIAELERHRRDLEEKWPPAPGASPLRIRVHPSLQAYQDALGSPLYQGRTVCTTQGAEIDVPAAQDPGIRRRSTPTLRHEMIHAIMCRSLGYHRQRMIPKWIHEGVASQAEHTGYLGMIQRGIQKMSIAIRPRPALEPRLICAMNPELNDETLAPFYQTSAEFVRALEKRHGRGFIARLIDQTGDGHSFNSRMVHTTGRGCTETYRHWQESW